MRIVEITTQTGSQTSQRSRVSFKMTIKKKTAWESIKQTNPCRVKSCPLPDTGKNRSSSEGDDRADRGGHCFKETTTTKLGLV